jgi:hypothetical protein
MGTFLYSESVPPGAFSITRIHYDGGGDWYADPSSLTNMLGYLSDHTNIAVNPLEKRAKIGDDIFTGSNYLYLTGHGNIKFSDEEAQTLRDHLMSGAFLHADDNFGMDKSFRLEIKKVFPEKDWVELPSDHPIFNIYYEFPNGLPNPFLERLFLFLVGMIYPYRNYHLHVEKRQTSDDLEGFVLLHH